MNTVAEIEEAISKLPKTEFRALLRRMTELEAEAFDRTLEDDAANGTLDRLWQSAQSEIARGEVLPLDEFLRNT